MIIGNKNRDIESVNIDGNISLSSENGFTIFYKKITYFGILDYFSDEAKFERAKKLVEEIDNKDKK